ncbi:MAG: LysR family transcriptional regulator [Hyphomicrobiaceae bacterium]
MDRLDAMAVFVAIAEAGSLTGAARRLKSPLTTVSRKLAALEEHLGVQLVLRTTRRLAPTEAGTRYLRSCKRLLGEIEDAERDAAGTHGTPHGDLHITAPIVFGRRHVLPIVRAFLAEHPQVDIGLQLLDRPVSLIDEGLDVAIRIGHLTEASLVATRLGIVRWVICASPRYLQTRGTLRTPSDLKRHDCIMMASTGSAAEWSFPSGIRERRTAIRARLTVNTAEAALDAARAGLGLTRVLSYQAEPAIALGKLRIVLADFEPPAIPVSLIYPEGRFMPAKTRAFIAFAVPRLRRLLASGERQADNSEQ